MKKIKAVLIDDEINCLGALQQQLEKYCPQVVVSAACESPEAGIEALQKFKPDIVFLDIEMPRMNGFQLLDKIGEIHFTLIFTTAYDQYAVKAFKYSALDYLLKPIDKQELIAAVEKVNQNKQLHPHQLELFNAIVHGTMLPPRIALAHKDGYHFISVSEIIFCEAQSNYTRFYLKDGSNCLTSKTLGDIEELLVEYGFYRIHKHYLINLNHIKKYIKGEGAYVVMSNDAVLSISRNRKEDFAQLFIKF